MYCHNCGKELYKESTKEQSNIKPNSFAGKKIGEELVTSGVKTGAKNSKKRA